MTSWFQALSQVVRYPAFAADLLLACAIRVCFWGSRVQIGRDSRFRGWPHFSPYPDSLISLGKRARLVSRPDDTALGVARRCRFRTLRAGARITIGDDFRASGITLCAMTSVAIGDRVVIGADALIVDTDFHSLDPDVRGTVADFRLAKARPVQIESDVFIGARAIILKGAVLRQGAVVGAGAVVTGTVERYSIVAGNPARVVGSAKPGSNQV
jgi:acetyltransferase-like isoleucine patch superfamily enzyme